LDRGKLPKEVNTSRKPERGKFKNERKASKLLFSTLPKEREGGIRRRKGEGGTSVRERSKGKG